MKTLISVLHYLVYYLRLVQFLGMAFIYWFFSDKNVTYEDAFWRMVDLYG